MKKAFVILVVLVCVMTSTLASAERIVFDKSVFEGMDGYESYEDGAYAYSASYMSASFADMLSGKADQAIQVTIGFQSFTDAIYVDLHLNAFNWDLYGAQKWNIQTVSFTVDDAVIQYEWVGSTENGAVVTLTEKSIEALELISKTKKMTITISNDTEKAAIEIDGDTVKKFAEVAGNILKFNVISYVSPSAKKDADESVVITITK
ncbi:MAG: hypothetical protein IJZ74_08585 [Clostridia bacterium]|nr:hypothetical protein [Clostridia bacterium]